MSAPLFACKRGTATATVPPSEGATYHWTVEGATLVQGNGTNRITISLGDTDAKLTCMIVSPSCTTTATGVIGVREPLKIGALVVPDEIAANEPLTIEWTYEGTAAPVSQLLVTDALAEPVVLDGARRRHTFTPQSGGKRTIEILGSYSTAIRPPAVPSPGRRRSAGRGTATATECANARAAADFTVVGCVHPTPRILAPAEVDPATTFIAFIELQADETVQWSSAGGTIVKATGAFAEVRAGSNEGELDLTVRIAKTTDASCVAQATSKIAVKRRNGCAVPLARVELAESHCDRAVVKAKFTGKPPFFGAWNDGQPFITMANELTREVTTFATYLLRDFSDASCRGKAEGSATYERYASGVTLTGPPVGTCANFQVTAKFTGKPPFKGVLYRDHTSPIPFTSDTHERIFDVPHAALYQIEAFSDAGCPTLTKSSNPVTVEAGPRATVTPSFTCDASPRAYVEFTGGVAPYVVTWPGVQITSNSASVLHTFQKPTSASETYTLVSAKAGGCVAAIDNASITVYRIEHPVIQVSDTKLCSGRTGTASLAQPMPPGWTLYWSINQGGEIVSGQGTSQVTFRAGKGWSYGALTLTATPPGSGPCGAQSDTKSVEFVGDGGVLVSFSPQGIAKRGFSELRVHVDPNVASHTVHLPARYAKDFEPFYCSGSLCRSDYHDVFSESDPYPRQVTVTVSYTGVCDTSQKLTSATLWVW